jgi:hypothetical protein
MSIRTSAIIYICTAVTECGDFLNQALSPKAFLPQASTQTPAISSTQASSLAESAAPRMAKTIRCIKIALSSTLSIYSDVVIACLLGLPGLGELLLSPPLGGLGTSLGVENKIPPPEAAGVVSDELLVVNVVVLSASPNREEVMQTPWELVTAVRVDGLEHTEDNPSVHGQDVQILGDGAPNNGAADSSETQDHDFDRRRVFSSNAEGSGILVVDLVDVLVQKGAGVHGAMRPVMPRILEDEEDGNLVGHCVDAGEWDGGRKAEVLAHWVEEPDLGELDGEVG